VAGIGDSCEIISGLQHNVIPIKAIELIELLNELTLFNFRVFVPKGLH